MAAAVKSMATMGDIRGRDLLNRHMLQANRAATAASTISVDHIMHGITAASGSLKGDSVPFELVKMSAVEPTADSYAGRLDITINDGTNDVAGVKVAELSAANAKFVASTLSADFGSSYTASFTKGLAQDGVTDATVQQFTTGSSGTSVYLKGSSDRMLVQAANADLSGALTVQGDRINWYQASGDGNKVSAAGTKYVYTHGDGLAGSSTGVAQFNLDPQNAIANAMGTSTFEFNTFDSTGATQKVMEMSSGDAAGAQRVNFTNANIGVGVAASPTYKLNVEGATRFSGDSTVGGSLTVNGDLSIMGDLTTISTSTINVEDKNILLGNGAITAATIDGGGLTLGSGTGADAVHLTYDDALKAWSADINQNVDATKSYLIAGGADTALDIGATLAESGLLFGKDTAALSLGTAVTLNSTQLNFASDDAKIYFGTAAFIDKTGFSSTDDSFATYYGALKQWRISRVLDGGIDFLNMAYCADGTVVSPVYETKFSIAA